MSAKDEILGTIRRSLGVTGKEAPRLSEVDNRLSGAPQGLVPRRGQVAGDEMLALFRSQAEAALTTYAEVNNADEVPAAVAEFLRNNNLPAQLRLGEDSRLSRMPWDATSLEIERGRSDGRDLIAVNHAFGGVAETGTLALTSSPGTPTTLNFLPDVAIAVVQQSDIVGDYESLWLNLREVHGKATMPRTVNWVTGPSRSGDIEQTILLGAHGPRSLHIVVVRN
jgi:L-lactate dehydrogenase complex protein LldG